MEHRARWLVGSTWRLGGARFVSGGFHLKVEDPDSLYLGSDTGNGRSLERPRRPGWTAYGVLGQNCFVSQPCYIEIILSYGKRPS